MKTYLWITFAVFAAALFVLPVISYADVPAEPLAATISITDSGLTDNIDQTPGLHLVTISNDSTSPRGLVLMGIDRGVSPYTRFTTVLQPSQSVSFRWYFPEDRIVTAKDLLRCVPVQTTCALPKTGGMEASIAF